MATILIRGGRVVDPANNFDQTADILIDGETIKAIDGKIGVQADEIIDAAGLLVTPGLIDLQVHLRQPGEEDKETVRTGSYAAAAGGFTSILAMPNTKPPIDTQADVYNIYHIANQRAVVRVYTAAAITAGLQGERITEFGDLVRAGAVAFTDDGMPVMNGEIMRRALEYTSMFNVPVLQHSEDLNLSNGHVMHAGEMSAKLGLPGYPSAAEAVIIARDVELAAMTGGHLHVQHVSAKRSVELIRAAKRRGVYVTAEATPHHLCLTEEAVEGFNTYAKMNPPLRSEEDRQALRDGLRDGTLDLIATDHAPHTEMEKELPFIDAPNGTIGLETAFPSVYTVLVESGVLELNTLIERMTAGPARVMGWEDKGKLFVGGPADVTIIDLNTEREVTSDTFFSRSKNSCFYGHKFKGWPHTTIVAGRIAYAHGAINEKIKSVS
ncbi:dihydroorotase [Candidatus Sumerlaeota bacterium]|nr:dihydroorotase [Candidatus Sumerlaeota bacterium]